MIFIIVGNLGMGKTTLIRNFISQSKRRKLVYTDKSHDFAPDKFKQKQVLQITDSFTDFVSLARTQNNTLQVVDDAANCIPKNQPDVKNDKKIFEKNVLVWLANSRDSNNLVILAFHNFSEVPVWLFKKGANYLFRFETNDQYNI